MFVCQELNPLSHLLGPHFKDKMALEIEPRALSKLYRHCALSYVRSPLFILYLRQGFTAACCPWVHTAAVSVTSATAMEHHDQGESQNEGMIWAYASRAINTRADGLSDR